MSTPSPSSPLSATHGWRATCAPPGWARTCASAWPRPPCQVSERLRPFRVGRQSREDGRSGMTPCSLSLSLCIAHLPAQAHPCGTSLPACPWSNWGCTSTALTLPRAPCRTCSSTWAWHAGDARTHAAHTRTVTKAARCMLQHEDPSAALRACGAGPTLSRRAPCPTPTSLSPASSRAAECSLLRPRPHRRQTRRTFPSTLSTLPCPRPPPSSRRHSSAWPPPPAKPSALSSLWRCRAGCVPPRPRKRTTARTARPTTTTAPRRTCWWTRWCTSWRRTPSRAPAADRWAGGAGRTHSSREVRVPPSAPRKL